MLLLSISFAIAAFAIFYAYDYCTVKAPDFAFTAWGFYAGILSVLLSVLFTVCPYFPVTLPPVRLIAALLFMAFGLGGLIKVLFFSLPKGTYTDPSAKRKVYDGGPYGLCRHPGFWPYLLFFAGLVVMFGSKVMIPAALLTILNLVYIILQDVWTFRHIFEDYDDYSRRVPFLLPNAKIFTSRSKGKREE